MGLRVLVSGFSGGSRVVVGVEVEDEGWQGYNTSGFTDIL